MRPRSRSACSTGAVTALADPPALVDGGTRFRNRRCAGRRLAEELGRYAKREPIVIGIPRGGVPVAAEVARALSAPLDVTVVRKIGAPQNPEFAIGALAEGGVRILDQELVRALGVSPAAVDALVARCEEELVRRLLRYRTVRTPAELADRLAIVIDDGLATGRSALAAIRALRRRGATEVVLAVPVAAPESAATLRAVADDVVCVYEPANLWAVGAWYEDFRPVGDAEVVSTLALSAADPPEPGTEADRQHEPDPPRDARADRIRYREVTIVPAPALVLTGVLAIPTPARGLVLFAHGSGSSHRSPRNLAVAQALNGVGYATLLFDLLTPVEELDRANVFDIRLLASRLLAASAWARAEDSLRGLPLAYFGASTGAAAALAAAAELGGSVSAVVSRGGRPDLAHDLAAVQAPTLLIVGGADREVLRLNREAQLQLRCANELAVVPGATHLFEEHGALERVSELAVGWLDRQMPLVSQAQTSGRDRGDRHAA
jgi:putative phosphoribosyl transferase